MTTWLSPTNSPIVGTLETLKGMAQINDISDDGQPEYAGETEIFWDDQRTVLQDDKILFVDENYDTWTFAQLHKEPAS